MAGKWWKDSGHHSSCPREASSALKHNGAPGCIAQNMTPFAVIDADMQNKGMEVIIGSCSF